MTREGPSSVISLRQEACSGFDVARRTYVATMVGSMRCSCHHSAIGSAHRRDHKSASSFDGFPNGHFGAASEQPAAGRDVHDSGALRLRSVSGGLRGVVGRRAIRSLGVYTANRAVCSL
jgi:hypothetical protein